MANPRRNSQNYDDPYSSQSWSSSISNLLNLLKRPLAFPFLLTIFLFLAYVSLLLQRSSPSPSYGSVKTQEQHWKSKNDVDVDADDKMANLVRFNSHHSRIVKDIRGWLLDPISLAREYGFKGGASSCASLHLGEIRAGGLRGNHRHHTTNETFVIWGAKTKFRLENEQVDGKGYAEVIVGADEVAVAVSPSGTAHALVNLDPVLTTFFIGCQDSIINYNSTSSDFNVWKDL